MPTIKRSPQMWNRATITGSMVLGLLCFGAGRLSVKQTDSGVLKDRAAVSVTAAATSPGFQNPPEAFPSRAEQPPSAPPVPGGMSERWRMLMTQPSTQARNNELAALLEKMAATDPARAMSLAQGQVNLSLRDKLVQATLRGWARLSCTDAARWALSVPPPEAREAAITSVFTGSVASNPTEAVVLGKRLIEQNPGEAVSYGGHLVDALCDAGNFIEAAQLAVSGDKSQSPFWIGEAYSKWASFQPQEAMRAASALNDPETRKLAMNGLVSGLSEVDPMAAVQLSAQLPSEGEKNELIGPALRRWTKLDPKAASEWINGHEMGGAMDEGVASLATMEALKPDVALGWADSVTDPKLRSETLVTVLRNIATTDLPAAKRYFDLNKSLLPDDRKEIEGVLATLGGQPARE